MNLTQYDLNRRIWYVIPFPSTRRLPVEWTNTTWSQPIRMKTKHCKIVTKGAGHSVMHYLEDSNSNTIAKDNSLLNLHRRILKMPNIKLLNTNQPFPENINH